MSQEQEQTPENFQEAEVKVQSVSQRDIKIGDKDFVLVIRPDLSSEAFVPSQPGESMISDNSILGISLFLMSKDPEAVKALVEGFKTQVEAAQSGPLMDLEQVLEETQTQNN